MDDFLQSLLDGPDIDNHDEDVCLEDDTGTEKDTSIEKARKQVRNSGRRNVQKNTCLGTFYKKIHQALQYDDMSLVEDAAQHLSQNGVLSRKIRSEALFRRKNKVEPEQNMDSFVETLKLRMKDKIFLKKLKAQLPKTSGLICPITQDTITDPVFAEDGHTYERSAIELWFTKRHVSPMTNLSISTRLVTNYSARPSWFFGDLMVILYKSRWV